MPNLDYIADLYDAEVAYLDFEIGRIFQHLASRACWRTPWSSCSATTART